MRFSIRDWMWLTIVIALVMCCFHIHTKLTAKITQMYRQMGEQTDYANALVFEIYKLRTNHLDEYMR